MSKQRSPDALTTWADIFREEGDTETADAIDRQLEQAGQRTLCDDDAQRVADVLADARRLDKGCEFEAAAQAYAEALQISERTLGACHTRTVEYLNDVARCQLNAGFYGEAIESYWRLERLALDAYGGDAGLAAIARAQVRFCHRGIRDVVGTMRLQGYVNDMLRRSRDQLALDAADRAERARAVARRLVARGRPACAVRLHETIVELRLQHATPFDEPAFIDLQHYSRDLRDAGEPGRAAKELLQLLAMRNRKSAWIDQDQELQAALLDMAACLSAQGQQRSAREARALAELIAKRLREGEASEGT